jgi:predicted nuclease of predicted toxin-antitoxin system
MRFLVDANVPRSAIALLQQFGHSAEHVRDLGLGASPDAEIALHAQGAGAILLTRDLDFADIRAYPPESRPGIIVMRLPDDAVARQILNLLERFLKQVDLVAQASGHLVILEADRVRFRPSLVQASRQPTPRYDKKTTYHRNKLLVNLGAEDAEPLFVLHRDGKVLAFTVNRWQNPQAPAEILVGPGSGREALAESFIEHKPTVPVFIHEDRDSKEWHYAGDFKFVSACDEPAEKNKRVKPFDIPAIYKILFLEEVL